jgi:2-isopropylmalate synthase
MSVAAAEFDWNTAGRLRPAWGPAALQDETLRDGLQSPSAIDPGVEQKIELLHRMTELGIDVVNVGLPAASEKNRADVRALCRTIASERLPLSPVAAARTVVSDVRAVVDVAQDTGVELGVYAFIGSSQIRQLAEAWDLSVILRHSAAAIDEAVREGLPVAYVTEDTTRAHPEVLAALFRNAIDHGASRLCLADTVGHATPDGVRALVEFTRNVVASVGVTDVGIDWHGHNDRGLVLVNAITAIEAGADRVHGTALGIGERVGNAPMELLLLNLGLLGLRPCVSREDLARYCQDATRALHVEAPPGHPILG